MSSATNSETYAEIIKFPLPAAENLHAFENGIAEVTRLGEAKESAATLRDYLITTLDGSAYVLREVLPNDQSYDIFVDSLTPLGTRVNGFNTEIALNRAKAGIPGRIIGANQKPSSSLKGRAIDAHKILSLSDIQTGTCLPDISVLDVISRGAMESFAFNTVAATYGRSVAYTVAVDPCLAEELTVNVNLIKHLDYAAAELGELAVILLKESRKRDPLDYLLWIKKLLGSLALSANTITSFLTLCEGQAGDDAKELPDDAAMSIHFFSGSRFNNQQQFRRILRNKPYVRFIIEQGRHLSITDPEAIDSLTEKHLLIQDMLAAGATKQELSELVPSPLLKSKRSQFSFKLFNYVP